MKSDIEWINHRCPTICMRPQSNPSIQLHYQGLSPCFYHLLVEVVSDNGRPSTMEAQYISHLFPDLKDVQERAHLDALWRHSEIVLKAAVTVAVLGGRYPIEQARRISRLAQQFGFSAKRLRILEDQALKAIHIFYKWHKVFRYNPT